MKVLLEIGQVNFICADATEAAKVAELLGKMTKVEQQWDYRPDNDPKKSVSRHVLVKAGRNHKVKISELEGYEIFETPEAWEEFEANNRKPEEGGVA